MLMSDFEASLAAERPPVELTPALRALWLDRKGDFDGAHALAQDMPGSVGARIHAYLHRKEGDLSNASYWYRRAACEVPRESLDEEWLLLVRELL